MTVAARHRVPGRAAVFTFSGRPIRRLPLTSPRRAVTIVAKQRPKPTVFPPRGQRRSPPVDAAPEVSRRAFLARASSVSLAGLAGFAGQSLAAGPAIDAGLDL